MFIGESTFHPFSPQKENESPTFSTREKKKKKKKKIKRKKREEERGILSGCPVNIESISITFWARQKAVIVRM